jgi:parallel beta-helix repeat protein
MMRRILATPALVVITIIASAWATQPALGCAVSARTDTVHVAPPTGVPDTDRASILAALARVSARGTVQFAPGTYVVGKLIAVTTPGVTLLGDPTGTILRGCEPADLSSRLPGAPPATPSELADCNVLGLAGDRQSVRQFTFENAWHGLILGCCWSERMAGRTAGGHRIEGNVFRNSSNGIRLIGDGAEPAVIRNNRFVNLFHAVVVNGMTAQILDNDISVPEPGRVPLLGHPSFALAIFEGAPPPDWRDETRDLHCTNNIIAGNRITGHPDAIVLTLVRPGGSCRHNTIRDNTIEVRRVGFTPPSDVVAVRTKGDSTIVGVPLLLANLVIDSGPRGVVEDNVVEGNRIVGAEGVGIEMYRATRNRIVDNNITGIRRRDPFPGNTLGSLPEWREGNGSGIWVSRGSNENQIAGNTFEEIAAHAVVLEGHSNRVELRRAGDSVRDLGIANRVSRPETPAADTEVATSILLPARSARRVPSPSQRSGPRTRHQPGWSTSTAAPCASACRSLSGASPGPRSSFSRPGASEAWTRGRRCSLASPLSHR